MVQNVVRYGNAAATIDTQTDWNRRRATVRVWCLTAVLLVLLGLKACS